MGGPWTPQHHQPLPSMPRGGRKEGPQGRTRASAYPHEKIAGQPALGPGARGTRERRLEQGWGSSHLSSEELFPLRAHQSKEAQHLVSPGSRSQPGDATAQARAEPWAASRRGWAGPESTRNSPQVCKQASPCSSIFLNWALHFHPEPLHHASLWCFLRRLRNIDRFL